MFAAIKRWNEKRQAIAKAKADLLAEHSKYMDYYSPYSGKKLKWTIKVELRFNRKTGQFLGAEVVGVDQDGPAGSDYTVYRYDIDTKRVVPSLLEWRNYG